ncbi:MAG: hypothetical protein AMJ81_04955 [Phycisphaerae bacterium SM23_33]|nr:MAG: hypothetical protein AMJ81_04955 [Phycisphaerae bacterium SM23_33]
MEFMAEGAKSGFRRWLKVLVVCLLILAAPVLYWLWCDHRANSTLQAELDAVKAAGDPIDFHDLAAQPIPDEENAAELYKQAVAGPLLGGPALSDESQEARLKRWSEMLHYLPSHRKFRAEHAEDVKQILAVSRGTLGLCRRARGLGRSDWKLNYSGPAISLTLPSLAHQRQLCRLLCTAALAAHEAGDDAEAVEYVRDMLALARSLDSEPVLIHNLVALAIDSTAYSAVEQISPQLRAGGRPPAATRKQVEALIRELLDERAVRQGLAWGLIGERSFCYDTCQRFSSGQLSLAGLSSSSSPAQPVAEGLYRTIFRPVLRRDTARLLRRAGARVRAARQGSFPAASKQLPVPTPATSFMQRFQQPLSLVIEPSLSRIFVLHFRGLATRRMAAVALAVRLYELDCGRRPEKLEQLVPKYLPAVPADPFAEDGRKITYLPKAKHPLLYSVNLNGKDDGGGYGLHESGSVDPQAGDLIFFLNGDRPEGKCDWQEPPPPQTQMAPPLSPAGQAPPPPPAAQEVE